MRTSNWDLKAAMVQKILETSTLLLNDLKNHMNPIFIFSDEKTFTVDPVCNKQNNLLSLENNVSQHRI